MKKYIVIILTIVFSIFTYNKFLEYSPFKYSTSSLLYDETIGIKHKINFQGEHIRECYNNEYFFDKNGLVRNIEPYSSLKKDVVILGDSYIDALMVKNEYIIHNSLSKIYNYKYNFLNYGLSDTSPMQHFVMIKEKIDLLNTKYIVHFINLEGDLKDSSVVNLSSFSRPKVFVDFEDYNTFNIIYPRKMNYYDKAGDFLGQFQLYTYIKKLLFHTKSFINNLSQKPPIQTQAKNIEKSWLNLEGSIYQINRLSQEKKIIYRVVVTSYDIKNIKRISKFLNESNIKFLLLPNENLIKLSSFECDKHWNNETHINISHLIKKVELIK